MILLLSLVSLAQAECLETRNAQDLSQSISQMESYFVAMDIGGFNRANNSVVAIIPCLNEPITPADAAAVHRATALRYFVVRNNDAALSAYVSALTSQPAYSLPSSIAPEGNSLHRLYIAAQSIEPEPLARLEIPPGTTLFVDGQRSDGRPLDRPALLQLMHPSGEVVWSDYVLGDDMDPDLTEYVLDTAIAPIPTADSSSGETGQDPGRNRGNLGYEFEISGQGSRPRAPASKTAKGFLGATAGISVAAIVLYGVALSAKAGHDDMATPYGDLEGLRDRANRSATGATVCIGLAAGMGAAAYFSWEW